MFLLTLRKSLPAATLAGAALFLGTVFTHSSVLAQGTQAPQATVQARLDEALKGFNRGHSVGQVAVAPNGKRLAWVQFENEGAEIRVAGSVSVRMRQSC